MRTAPGSEVERERAKAIRELHSEHTCHVCGTYLVPGNIGGYRAGVPDICRSCEEAADYKTLERFATFGKMNL